ncbi:MAG: acyloxyacyl hydrolase [Phycisphaerales bacterium]|nr:acyloxyacyl hydrolase [Phycisphaerales bacterium]
MIRAALALIIVLVASSPSRAEAFHLDDASLKLDTTAALAAQPEAPVEPAASSVDPAPEGNPAFGLEGHRAWSMQFGTALVHDSTDYNLSFNLHHFLDDDFELLLSFGGWLFDQQDGDSAAGGSFSFGFRYHALGDEQRDWTGYFDFGIGILGANDEVPDGGTAFDFIPRAGVGATFRLGDGPERLDVGVRWQHISNATILGSDDNPARDSLMFYVGIMVPF